MSMPISWRGRPSLLHKIHPCFTYKLVEVKILVGVRP